MLYKKPIAIIALREGRGLGPVCEGIVRPRLYAVARRCQVANVYKRGEKWWIRFQTGGKDYKEPAGRSKRDAERALNKRLVEIDEGRFLGAKRCRVTLEGFAPRFLEWSKLHKRSHARDARLMKNLCAGLGTLLLNQIDLAAVESYKARRLSGDLVFGRGRIAGPATVNRELRCLSRALSLAEEWGVLSESPLRRRLKLLREAGGRTRYLTPEESSRLLGACALHLRPVVEIALLSGMRKSEILGLTWGEVHLERGAILLPAERCKNGRPRTVPLNSRARDLLGEIQRARVDGCALVFHREGQPLRCIRTAFEAAVRRAGFDGLVFHDLRHAFGSALAQAGVPLQAVAELLGHRSVVMAQRYAHLSPQGLQAASEAAGRFFAPGSASAAPALALVASAPPSSEAAPADSSSATGS